MVRFAPPSKPVTLVLFKGRCQIKSKLLHITDWDRDGKAAPFRRNDVLLNFLPKGLLAFPGSGITNNMIDKARKIGIPVLLAAA